MTLVQEYLRDRSLTQLAEDHGIKYRIHGHKVSLNYCPIASRDDDLLTHDCRGLILACDHGDDIDHRLPMGTTEILARPFSRFFNLGQAQAAPVDLADPGTRFYEKLDGTLAIVYYDRLADAWHVATRRVPEADIPIDTEAHATRTFRDLFEAACLATTGEDFATWTWRLDRGVTYLFELCTPYNRVVVEHDSMGITLLGARYAVTGEEIGPVGDEGHLLTRTPHAAAYAADAVTEAGGDVMAFVAARDPLEHEGLVACDAQFRRVKIKSAAYHALNIAIHSAESSPRALMRLYLMGKLDDVMPMLSVGQRAKAQTIADAWPEIEREHTRHFIHCAATVCRTTAPEQSDRDKRKAFAIAAKAPGRWLPPLMDRYAGNSDTLREWVMSRRQDDGVWAPSLLDALIEKVGL